MKRIQSGKRIALVTAMIFLAILGFNLSTVHAHGHGGGGHAGGGHHSEHPHEHFRGGDKQTEGSGNGSYYRHNHDNYGEHRHDCRILVGSEEAKGTGQSDPFNEECQHHNGEWEPNSGD